MFPTPNNPKACSPLPQNYDLIILFNAKVLTIHFLFTFMQYRDEYLGKQRPTPSEADRLGATGVGTKEPSGYVENHDRFIQTDDNPARFVTHYSTKYVHISFSPFSE